MNSKNSIGFRKKWLQWVLDFSQTDLKSFRLARMKILQEEVSYFCSEWLSKISWEEFEERLSSSFSGEYEGLTQIDDRGRAINLNKIQKRAFDFLTALNNIHGSEELTLPEKDTFKIHHPVEPIPLPEMSSLIASSSQGFEIYRHPKTDSPADWLIINFMALIEKCEAYPIKKCKGCSRFFLNLTKFDKIYCSGRCASRTINYRKYQELKNHPKEYKAHLKEHRKYSKERYRNLRIAQYGPNVKIGKLAKKRNRKG